jgi:hypothetical protein
MLIDCDACTARGPACGDCVVTVLLSGPPAHGHAPPPAAADGPSGRAPLVLDGAERTALANLARSGLVPPLRLVPLERPRPPAADDGDGDVSCVS